MVLKEIIGVDSTIVSKVTVDYDNIALKRMEELRVLRREAIMENISLPFEAVKQRLDMLLVLIIGRKGGDLRWFPVSLIDIVVVSSTRDGGDENFFSFSVELRGLTSETSRGLLIVYPSWDNRIFSFMD